MRSAPRNAARCILEPLDQPVDQRVCILVCLTPPGSQTICCLIPGRVGQRVRHCVLPSLLSRCLLRRAILKSHVRSTDQWACSIAEIAHCPSQSRTPKRYGARSDHTDAHTPAGSSACQRYGADYRSVWILWRKVSLTEHQINWRSSHRLVEEDEVGNNLMPYRATQYLSRQRDAPGNRYLLVFGTYAATENQIDRRPDIRCELKNQIAVAHAKPR